MCAAVDLGFLLAGALYSNNSVVALRDIEQTAPGSVGALYCLTNNTSCCRGRDGLSAGVWFLSSQTVPVVGENDQNASSADFTRARAPSALLLNRRNILATGPSGVYTCQIPDSSGETRTLYIGVDTTGTVM